MPVDAEDTDALEDRIAAYAPRVYGLLMRLVGKRDVAEDLMQETLLRAYGGLHRYRPQGQLRAWIFRIAVNLARDWIRRRPRRPVLGLEDPDGPAPDLADDPDRAPEANLHARERNARVAEALDRLSEPDREVLLLRFYGDLAFKDIARTTGEPIGTVLARAHRALHKLADLLPGEET